MRPNLPAGTVTFLFTDVEGSTRLLQSLGPERYADALAEHRRLVRGAAVAQNGVEVDTQGDAFFLAFPTAESAASAALEIARQLAQGVLQVRAGLHTGSPLVTAEGYVGEDVHIAARIAAAGHGGQVLASGATAAQLGDPLRDLGEHRLKDIEAPISIFQLGTGRFPPLRTIANTNLPRPASSFVGRERELAEIRARLGSGTRLLTLTGPGGSGKTRLALEAAASLVPAYRAGVFWVALAAVRDPSLVLETIAGVLGARNGLADHIGSRELLVLVDNLEHVIGAAPQLSALLADCPNLTLLVTSRERLRVQGEVELSVPPLAEAEAVALFTERSQLEPTAEIAELCRCLDLLPLAVELAAARTKALAPGQILERLSERLDLLRGGRDADPRQLTLRTTIEWSYDLLDEAERRLLRSLSVFSGGCTLAAAEAIAAADLDVLQSLVEKSLVRFSAGRYALLESIREFAAGRLGEQDAETLRRRHRAYFVAEAEAAAPRLHTGEESAESTRLAPDYPNVRAAVASAFAAGEPNDVGRLVGGLYPFLISQAHLAEAREWIEAALARPEQLSGPGLADLLVAGSELARFAGDLDRAIELKDELVSVGGEPLRPNWKANTVADLAEIWIDRGDFARARRYAELSVELGVGPRAALALAELALRSGDLAAAESEGLVALGSFAEGSFNHAAALEALAEAARRAGDDVLAGDRFRRALRAFAALDDGGGMADCLDGLARLSVDPQYAGRLAGAAEQLRETRGRRPIRTDLPPPDGDAAAREEGRSSEPGELIELALLRRGPSS